MLNRAFTKTEEILLLIITVLLMGLLYYQFVYKAQQAAIVRYDTSGLEAEMLIEQARAAQIKSMQDEIAQNKKDKIGVVETYNNLKQEINELNDIFGGASDFDFGFDQAVADGEAVRRIINASFGAPSYEEARTMLNALHNCPYRCLITQVQVVPDGRSQGDNNLHKGAVKVNFSVTFYETLHDAQTTDGLLITNTENGGSSTLLDDLQASREAAENTGL